MVATTRPTPSAESTESRPGTGRRSDALLPATPAPPRGDVSDGDVMGCRQLVGEGDSKEHARHWQNEILETCAAQTEERFQRGHTREVSQEESRPRQVRARTSTREGVYVCCSQFSIIN